MKRQGRSYDREHTIKQLYEAVLGLEGVADCRDFFDDICTKAEIEEISRRFLAAKLLAENASYLEVAEITGLSTATISRVSRALKNGNGGYARALARMAEKDDEA